MTTADNNEPKTPATGNSASPGAGDVDRQLAELRSQLANMNQNLADSLKKVVDVVKPQPAPKKAIAIDDEDIYDAGKLGTKVTEVASRIANETLQNERKLNAKIYELAQEYPEIQSNDEVRRLVIEANNNIREDIRDTVEGYEMAVLRAVSKAGLVPKSKRQHIDEDASGGSRRTETRRTEPKKKVSENTLLIAKLLGRDIEDPAVKAGLENASNRDSFGRYR